MKLFFLRQLSSLSSPTTGMKAVEETAVPQVATIACGPAASAGAVHVIETCTDVGELQAMPPIVIVQPVPKCPDTVKLEPPADNTSADDATLEIVGVTAHIE